MFKQFFTFEVRFWLRSWMLWVFFLIVALMFFGAASSDQITVGSSLKNTYRVRELSCVA
jgi:ABC-2 type transport system permease protein